MPEFVPPTRSGAAQGRDPVSGIAWRFEAPEAHWAAHDGREVAYWLSRPPAERLAQAAEYRRRVHGSAPRAFVRSFRFVDPYEE